jgi:antitoxin HicB
MTMPNYPITLTPDDNQTIMATCADLPEVTTFGNDETEAMSRAADAIAEAIAARKAAGLPIPQPSA